MEADDHLTSAATYRNNEANSEQMDALEELYSLKNLERRDRKISKAKSQMLGSVKITHLSQMDSLQHSHADFVQMTFQSEEQVVSWDFLALLQEFKNMYIIGVVGKKTDVQKFIHRLTGELLEMPSDNMDCLHFSRKWIWPRNSKISWCFLIRYTDKRTHSENAINDVVFTIAPHILVVFESLSYNVQIVLENCRKYQHLRKNITGLEQSLFVRLAREKSTLQQAGNFFVETLISNPEIDSLSFIDTTYDDLLCLITRNIKRNYQQILTNEPITLYYLVISLWTFMKRILTASDFVIENMVTRSIRPLPVNLSNLSVADITHVYLQVLEKELRYDYKVKTQIFLKQPMDQFFLYQCMKEEKEQCLNKLIKYSNFCKTEKSKIYEKLCDFIHDTEIEAHKWNQEMNFKRNYKLAHQYSQNISCKIAKNLYKSTDHSLIHQDFCEFLQNYENNCIGTTGGQALFKFLKDFIPSIYIYFDVTTQQEIKEIVQNRQLAESKQDVNSRIAMTEGVLVALEKDIAQIQNRRLVVERKKRNLEQQSSLAKESLQKTKQQILKMKTKRKSSKRMALPVPILALTQPEKENYTRRCLIF